MKQAKVNKLTVSIMYYPVFRHLKSHWKVLHAIFACDEDHQKVFPDVLIIGFNNNRNLKSHLVRAVLADVNEADIYEPCNGERPPCQLCSNMKNTSTFKSNQSNKVYHIKKIFTIILKWWWKSFELELKHHNLRKEQKMPNQTRNQSLLVTATLDYSFIRTIGNILTWYPLKTYNHLINGITK